jgi:hypothetical protein
MTVFANAIPGVSGITVAPAPGMISGAILMLLLE